MTIRRLPLKRPSFGRRAVPMHAAVAMSETSVGDDVRLFAMTFLGGFLFMAVYLA